MVSELARAAAKAKAGRRAFVLAALGAQSEHPKKCATKPRTWWWCSSVQFSSVQVSSHGVVQTPSNRMSKPAGRPRGSTLDP